MPKDTRVFSYIWVLTSLIDGRYFVDSCRCWTLVWHCYEYPPVINDSNGKSLTNGGLELKKSPNYTGYCPAWSLDLRRILKIYYPFNSHLHTFTTFSLRKMWVSLAIQVWFQRHALLSSMTPRVDFRSDALFEEYFFVHNSTTS